MARYALDVAGLSDRGVRRDHNEDAWSLPPLDLTAGQMAAKGRLYVVADGVGGHQAGDVASKLAVEFIQQCYYADPTPDVAASLKAAIHASNQAINHEAADKLEQYGMGTTVTAAVVRGNELTVANVGDSRTYLIRKGHARQVTTDHTWVEEQVQIGLITRAEAAKHPQRNIITRSLGGQQKLYIDIFEEQLMPGDSVLLCSDGLSNTVSAPEIGASVSRSKSAKVAVHELVELARQRGAPDNVTAVVLKVKRARHRVGRLLVTLGVMGGLTLLIGLLAPGILPRGAESASPVSKLRPGASAATSLPTLAPATPTAPPLPATPTTTLLPLDLTISQPELIWPAQGASVAAGQALLFSWQWEQQLAAEGWRFVFDIRPAQDAPPLLREELPLNQRGFALSQPLEPGEYWWSVSLTGTYRRGEPATRRLVVVEPTPIPHNLN
jgi:serine/threonine protein phosphatase PrpC